MASGDGEVAEELEGMATQPQSVPPKSSSPRAAMQDSKSLKSQSSK